MRNPNLANMTMSELVDLYNQNSPRPIKRFADKQTAIKRVRGVLQKNVPAGEEAELALFKSPITVLALAERLGTTTKGARNMIDRLRRKGNDIRNVGPCTFGLH